MRRRIVAKITATAEGKVKVDLLDNSPVQLFDTLRQAESYCFKQGAREVASVKGNSNILYASKNITDDTEEK